MVFALRHRRHGIVTITLASAVAAGSLALGAGASQAARTSTTPTLQQIPNSGVHAMIQKGSWMYIGGTFTRLTDPKTGKVVVRQHLARVSVKTGALDLKWHPGTNGDVRSMAVSKGGHTLYIAGSFTHLNTLNRAGIGAVSIDDGHGRAWYPKVTGSAAKVSALLSVGSNLVMGGSFSHVGGKVHHNIALVSQKTAKPVAKFKGATTGSVDAVALSITGRALYVGGKLTQVGTSARPFLGKMAITTGATSGWNPAPACATPSATNPCYVMAIRVSGQRVFAGIAGVGGRLAAYDATKGKILWRDYTDGDVQAMTFAAGKLYVGGHFTQITSGTTTFSTQTLAIVSEATGAVDQTFKVSVAAARPGVWALRYNADGLFVGGDMTAVNGTTQQYFTRFRPI